MDFGKGGFKKMIYDTRPGAFEGFNYSVGNSAAGDPKQVIREISAEESKQGVELRPGTGNDGDITVGNIFNKQLLELIYR